MPSVSCRSSVCLLLRTLLRLCVFTPCVFRQVGRKQGHHPSITGKRMTKSYASYARLFQAQRAASLRNVCEGLRPADIEFPLGDWVEKLPSSAFVAFLSYQGTEMRDDIQACDKTCLVRRCRCILGRRHRTSLDLLQMTGLHQHSIYSWPLPQDIGEHLPTKADRKCRMRSGLIFLCT